MAQAKKFDPEADAPIVDDEAIRDPEAGQVVPAENVREVLGVRNNSPDIKELLLGPGPRFEDIVPKRGGWQQRPPIDFSGPDFK
jgi:hypothetical protein